MLNLPNATELHKPLPKSQIYKKFQLTNAQQTKFDADISRIIITNEISEALGRGVHTTRMVTLYRMFGGLIADTPGFSSLELNISKEDIKKYSKEFNVSCKYKSCMHMSEDGCSVIPKLHKDKIYDERYNNYIKLIREV